MKLDTKECILYYSTYMKMKSQKNYTILFRDAHRGGNIYKEKLRRDSYEIRLVATYRCKGEDCDQKGHPTGFWSLSNAKCLNLSGRYKCSFYNLL